MCYPLITPELNYQRQKMITSMPVTSVKIFPLIRQDLLQPNLQPLKPWLTFGLWFGRNPWKLWFASYQNLILHIGRRIEKNPLGSNLIWKSLCKAPKRRPCNLLSNAFLQWWKKLLIPQEWWSICNWIGNILLYFINSLFEIFIFVQKFNFDFPRTIVDIFGWKTRENVVVLDFLAVDNFVFTRKIVKKILGEKLVKKLGFL